ncbi:excinuclease ABC subunit UvrC [Cytophagaceae bacterium YF14B1]|uniref:UvrABC system protein C n=1 Tax=Xanthocytophaga flava TaxID=3048013 RepID=A0AAE3QXZ2_9BACT|nr:excinuclease ABC subunit UvrC [Xanthocytophaga flavus]MDJ1485291.1 excinuclease ABC subunit UvrC [Xanthocytophaga flavus]
MTVLKEQISKLPDTPGVYRYFDIDNELIYVGKAKNLKNRVSSYFNKSANHDQKTRRMVSQIDRLEFTVVNSEFDALLLENSLIKQYQPKYNILLRDDKTYPYLCITNEPFPKLIPTRHLDRSLGTYFGPYASVKTMHTLLEFLRKLYTIRTCNLNLTQKNIEAKKFKVCLEYHIGNCKGPCEGLVSREEYDKNIDQVKNILKGHLSPAIQHFKEQMQEAAMDLAFERAQEYKEKLSLLEGFQSKSLIVNPNISNIDVFTIASDDKNAYVNYMQIVDGSIIHTKNALVQKKLDESEAEILSHIILGLREEHQSESKEILTNASLEIELPHISWTIPQIGDKKKLVDLSLKNALYFKRDLTQKKEQKGEVLAEKGKRALVKLQQDLQLKVLPTHIECFDNSNFQGTNPVSAMVCFKNGVPSKKDYRHYKVKTVEGPDDFATMHEVVTRRYTRLLNENAPLPSLIVIDGGKGQLGAATQALKELGIYGQIPIIGIAKRLEEIYFPGDEIPIHIDKKSESLKLIQRIRDEAHRFGITFHRDLRSKNTMTTQLFDIPGIGPETANKLLTLFKSVKKLREATMEELTEAVGKSKAQKVRDFFEGEG